MTDVQMGRIVTNVIMHLPGYHTMMESHRMEMAMDSYYGCGYRLPIEKMMDKLLTRACTLLAPKLGVSVDRLQDCYYVYLNANPL